MSERTIEKAVRDYLALRAEISRVNAEAKERVATCKLAQRNIGDYIEQQRRVLGVENFRTADGTAFEGKWERVKVADWDTFLAWLIQSGMWQMLTKAVSSEAVIEYMKQTGQLPPGISYEHGVEIRVRKGTK